MNEPLYGSDIKPDQTSESHTLHPLACLFVCFYINRHHLSNIDAD